MTAEYPEPNWVPIYAKLSPEITDPFSRQVKYIAENMRAKGHPLRKAIKPYDTPDRIAESLEQTVIMLWEARAALDEAGYERKGDAWVKK